MKPKTEDPRKMSPRKAALPSRTKSFLLQGSTAGKVEALADALDRSESSIVNDILETSVSQMILERVPDIARQWPPLRNPHERIEGALRIRRPGAVESEGVPAYSFEVIGEVPGFNDRPAAVWTHAYIYDAERKIWRRLDDEEAVQLVRDVHGGGQVSILTQAGIRWALVEVRDMVNRDFAPPRRDILVRLHRVPSDLCPACGSPLKEAKVAVLAASPAASYFCENTDCRRLYAIDRSGGLVSVPAPAGDRPRGTPVTFAQLRGLIPAGFAVNEEDLRQARGGVREIP